MDTIPHYCQSCGANNLLGERDCRRCGTRLMLVVFPASIRHDEGIVPSYYEDHLLERVTLLEIRLSQVAERLAIALDLVLQQTKNNHSDHLLLETVIDSLNTLGAVEMDGSRQGRRKRAKDGSGNDLVDNSQRVLRRLCLNHHSSNPALYIHLVKEGLKFLDQNEEKQALRNFERALEHSPQNVALILYISNIFFQADKFVQSQNYLDRALECEPQNVNVFVVSGLIHADSLEIEKAKKLIGNLQKNRADSFSACYAMGLMAAFEKDWASALRFFDLIPHQFDFPEKHYLVGCVHFQTKDYTEALRRLQKAVEIDTNFADAWFILSVIYKLIGDETKSSHSLDLAWSSKETGAECLRYLKRGTEIEVSDALPFIRLKGLKKHLIMGASRRFTKIVRGEVSKMLGD